MLVVVVLAAWIVVSLGVALGLGRAIHLADRHAPYTDHLAGLPADLTVDDVLGAHAPQPSA